MGTFLICLAGFLSTYCSALSLVLGLDNTLKVNFMSGTLNWTYQPSLDRRGLNATVEEEHVAAAGFSIQPRIWVVIGSSVSCIIFYILISWKKWQHGEKSKKGVLHVPWAP